MILVILTVALGASLIAVLASYLFAVGFLLRCIADNFDDCLAHVKTIAQHAEVIVPGVEHINRTGRMVAGALPLLYGGAERVAVKLALPFPVSVNGYANFPASGRRRSRLMDTVGFRARHHEITRRFLP